MISDLSWYDLLSATVSMERSNVWFMVYGMVYAKYVQIITYYIIWQISNIEVAENVILKNEIWNGLFGTVKWASTGAQCSN